MLKYVRPKKTIISRLYSVIIKSPALFFLFSALVMFFILLYIDKNKDPEGFKLHDVIVELHGVLFDLIVFGVLLSIYETLRSKNERVERLLEELEDYKGWQQQEATYRLVGIIKRLNKLGVDTELDLTFCYLENAPFIKPKLWAADFENANLKGARFLEGILIGANFKNANLENALFLGTKLVGANFEGANLTNIVTSDGTDFELANFTRANLEKAQIKHWVLNKANLTNVNLKGAYVGEGWFENLEKWNVIGVEEIKKNYTIDFFGFIS